MFENLIGSILIHIGLTVSEVSRWNRPPCNRQTFPDQTKHLDQAPLIHTADLLSLLSSHEQITGENL